VTTEKAETPTGSSTELPIWSTVVLFVVIQVVDQLLSRRVSLVTLADQTARRGAINTVELITDVVFVVVTMAIVVAVAVRLTATWLHRLVIVYVVFAVANLLVNVGTLVATAQFQPADELGLLWDVALVYANTVLVFAVMYRMLDIELGMTAFEFPEDPNRPDRRPGWVEYIFLSFNTNATFGPTVETVHSRIAKVLMMTQTVMSLTILVVLVARIVGVGG
jgi:hypothetical protein